MEEESLGPCEVFAGADVGAPWDLGASEPGPGVCDEDVAVDFGVAWWNGEVGGIGGGDDEAARADEDVL